MFKSLNRKQARVNISKNRDIIISLANALAIMAEATRENLVDVRETQYYIMRAIAVMTDWNLILPESEAADLLSFSTAAGYKVSWADEEDICHETSTEQIRKYNLPLECEKVIDERTGQTVRGFYPRIAANFFIKENLMYWSEKLKEYAEIH